MFDIAVRKQDAAYKTDPDGHVITEKVRYLTYQLTQVVHVFSNLARERTKRITQYFNEIL